MATRVDLQRELETILGNRNVYFQPPATIKISYPAIIYELNDIQRTKADNEDYLRNKRYKITLIHKDPDNDIVDKLLSMKYTRFNTFFVVDGLNHYVFETVLD